MELLTFHIDKVNWLAVCIATLASFAVGGFWYSKAVFGRPWMKALKLKDKDLQSGNMAVAFAITGVLAFVTVAGLATLMCALKFTTAAQGALFGALVSAVFAATSRGIHMVFERKGLGLFFINAGHDMVFLTLAGAIIGAF